MSERKVRVHNFCNSAEVGRLTTAAPWAFIDEGQKWVTSTDGKVAIVCPAELVDGEISVIPELSNVADYIKVWIKVTDFTHRVKVADLMYNMPFPENPHFTCPLEDHGDAECPSECQGCASTPYAFGPHGHVLRGEYLSLLATAFYPTETLQIHFAGIREAVVFKCESVFAVLMPMIIEADDDEVVEFKGVEG